MGREKVEGICSELDCGQPIKSRGWCKYHYQKFYKSHTEYNQSTGFNLRTHSLYSIWHERKQAGYLCEAWLDFTTFIKDVGEKPKGRYFLVRLKNELYGPDNFKWQEHLKRKPDETRKEWWARKWAARQAQNPSMERARHFKRKYDITLEEYELRLHKQDFKCEICKAQETSFDGKSGTLRRLAVDHCHKTNKVRGLLCWRCNAVLGKVEEDIDLLERMKFYLLEHKGT